MKKLGFFIATLLMVLVVLKPTLAYADTTYDYQDENFGYSLSGAEDKYILEAYLGTSTEVTIPAEANGKPVAVSGNLFQNNTIVESLTFSDGVEILTSEDYYGSKYVEFSGTDSIKKVVFQGDVDFSPKFTGPLEVIEFDKNYYNADAYKTFTSYENTAALKNFTVKGGVACAPAFTTLGKNLESIEIGTIPETEKSNLKFSNLKQLKRVVLPTNLDVIPRACFSSCTSLCEVVIPASLTKIAEFAFSDCSALSSISLPKGLTEIKEQAFENCTSLKRVELPSSLKTIGTYVFYNCTSLQSVNYTCTKTKPGGGMFYQCPALYQIIVPKNLVFTDDWYSCGATGSRITIVCEKGSKAATSAAKYSYLVWPSTETAVEAGAPELLSGAAEQIRIYNNPGITFKSSNKKVLSVDKDGKLRANKAGKAKIKLYKGKKLFKTISYTVVARNYDNALNILYKYYVTPTMSDYEKVIAADTWLCKFCSYDYQNYLRGTIPDISYEAFGVFDRGVAVCDGYAKAFRQIMEHYNIPCYRVVGVANGGGHAWNLVKIGDKWTYVDSTWDDPIYNGGKDGELSTQNYLMISPNDLQRDHSWAIGAYPAASTNKKFDENICHTGIYNAVLNKVNISVKKGKTTTLKVTETNQKVTFSSSNKKVATVTKDGKIKGIKKGTTTIKITIGDVKIKLDVTVK